MSVTRRQVLTRLLGLGTLLVSAPHRRLLADDSPDTTIDDTSPLIHAPTDPRLRPSWRRRLAERRVEVLKTIGYDDRRYRAPETAWTASSFSSCVLMLYDQMVYDARSGRYQVDEFLRHAQEEFGGFDNVILWHAYPRIGADERNQFDFYREMPGGLNGLRDVVRQCRQRGVKAFIVYKPWDTGTRRELVSDVDALVAMVRAIEAAGVYLDTMPEAPERLRDALDESGEGLVMEGEGALPIQHIHDHHLSWAQNFEDSEAPGILRNKWLEPRHMMHQVARWRRDRTPQLHTAWMNGSGMVVWETVFGSWVGWSARDRQILRSMLPIQRRFATLFAGGEWTPLVHAERPDVYVTLWEEAGIRLWTLINRADRPISGVLLKVPQIVGAGYFDVIAGLELQPHITTAGLVCLQGTLTPRGIGGFVAGPKEALGPDFSDFLTSRQQLRFGDISSTKFPRRPVKLLSRPTVQGRSKQSCCEGMIEISATDFAMRTQLRTRECGFYGNEMDQDRLYANFHKPQWFERTVRVSSYAIDVTPVTNAQYAEFLLDTQYQPLHPENFLKHWIDGRPPVGKEDHPVVYVGLEDARVYASWAGKALPTEEQWQYAAQGPTALMYPWGNTMEPGRCNGGEAGTTTGVTAHPDGRSPFGCYDMCGNVWEWTASERTDGRIRFCMIRGGSYYRAVGSHWYMDGGPQPTNFAAKFLLMWPGLDRCATIGFRCVRSIASE